MANNEIYMDGIKVKISEKYKPPPRINLPMSYAQRLTLNKQIQDSMPSYDFTLEKSVKEQLKEWKNARAVMFRELKERIEKTREEINKQKNEEKVIVEESSTSKDLFNSNYILPQVSQPQYSNILTPIPLAAPTTTNNFTCQPNDKSPFNISDFEADTSSPFDNMELKTINDMEELAQVLRDDSQYQSQPLTQQPQPQQQLTYPSYQPYNPNTTTNYIPNTQYLSNYPTTTYTNGYYYPPETQINHFNPCQYKVDYNTQPKMSTCKSVPDIVKSLTCELDNTHIDNNLIDKRPKAISESTPKTSDLNKIINESGREMENEKTFKSLPIHLQDLTKAISSMGFPLERVARVCKVVGNDHKKVVEHLLVMTELLDLGFPEQRVTEALLQCNNDRDKALDVLIS